MKKNIMLLILIALLFNGCSTLRVSSDYDTSFDMKTLKQFHIIHNSTTYKDTLTIKRIDAAITHELTAKGYKAVSQKEANFLVYYHINVKNKTQVVTSYQSMGMYPYRYGGMMMPTTHTYNYDEGQLIVDMINPRDNNIVYRMNAKDQLKTLDTPKERTEYINEVIKTLLKEFPKKSL
ncbi:MAG: DUF4136 domain-containing protein [Campylobacterota bacterium]|nr:DUF4136 domain-containing protein [Campylobacterota bacterium]